MKDNCDGVKNTEFKICELNAVSQKLIPHSFVPHSCIPHSSSLVIQLVIEKVIQ